MKLRLMIIALLLLLILSCSELDGIANQLQPPPTPTKVRAVTPLRFTETPTTSSPRVNVRVNPATLMVGEQVTISGVPEGIGLPYYHLNIMDLGAAKANTVIRVTYDNKTTVIENNNTVLEFISARGGIAETIFILKGKGAGVVEAWINATGEVRSQTGATWAGGGSEKIRITVRR